MPISPIVLQRRHAELGRIRLGAKRNGNGAPMKLEQFRFTTHSERYARDLAELYGGQAQAWDNAGVASWEVYSTATSIPVIAVKGGLSQWMETWSGGGCVHRCDGERTADGEMCDPKDRNHINAKPTTRLSVMLPELEAIGVWRMESHGWNAAAEIPAVAELAQYVGDLVPANLHLVERRSIKDGKTSRFVVPVLDLQIGTARLKQIVAEKSGAPELQGPGQQPAAIESGQPRQEQATAVEDNPGDYRLWLKAIADADHVNKLAEIWADMVGATLVGPQSSATPAREAFVVAFKARADVLKSTGNMQAVLPDAGTDADGPTIHCATCGHPEDDCQCATDAPTGESDPDTVWQQIIALASERRGWSLDQVVADFRDVMNMVPDDASARELAAYLHVMATGQEPAA